MTAIEVCIEYIRDTAKHMKCGTDPRTGAQYADEAEREVAELRAIKDRMQTYTACEKLMGEDLSDYPKGAE